MKSAQNLLPSYLLVEGNYMQWMVATTRVEIRLTMESKAYNIFFVRMVFLSFLS
jgi:hypothetical protein